MSKLQNHVVGADEADIRLDRWFKRHFAGLSHGQLQKLLRTGQVRVDGKRVDASVRLKAGQEIRVPPQASTTPEFEIKKKSVRATVDLKKLILFEDDDVIVLNKPSRLAVQVGTGLKENLDDMLHLLAGEKGPKPKLVHRLDRDTSGVLLVARTAFAATRLSESFRHRDTQKIYWALTLGVPKPEQGRIAAPLIKEGEAMIVDEEGRDEESKSAITLYQVVEHAKPEAAFVALRPITGRTHQLRVHMQYIGTPIFGDPVYAGEKASVLSEMDELGRGLHLHARRLIIPHPRRGVIDVKAPMGPAMKKTWKYFNFDESADPDFDD